MKENGKNLKVNESIIDLIEKGEKYREGLKNDYTANRVDEEFRKEAEQFAINLKNGSIDRMFKEFDKKAKEQ